ncbi:MAG TPA: NRDE family protein [Opitutaceae bacterium]
MCTLTWWPASTGYDLFFNRDELDTRAPEAPPREERAGGVRFLAPRDGEHGGTWLTVNEHGLTIALLNDYAARWRAPEPHASRGALVLAAATADSLEAVGDLVAAGDLAHTGAFHLFAIDATASPLLAHWNGVRLHVVRGAAVPGFLSSSSFRTAEVIAYRQARYGSLAQAAARPPLTEVLAFHRRHDPSAGAYSVCMRRPDAATRSISHVQLREDHIELTYQPRSWTGVSAVEQRFLLERGAARR